MRVKILLLILCSALLFISLPAFAVITDDGYNDLILGASGDTLIASGMIYRTHSIVVQPGAGIYLPQNQTSDSTKWSLQLVAPYIYIGGTLCAEGVSFATNGAGVVGSNSNSGTGGSGYGGVGGDGQNNPGTGGPTYLSDNLAHPGSMGANNSNGGGGSIRLDAESLTLAATALINARASQIVSHTSGGGGSGGCIYINGIQTYFANGADLIADGGPGQLEGLYVVGNGLFRLSFTSSGGGGGAGGRIKIFEYPYGTHTLFTNAGVLTSSAGGTGGGGTPTPASNGKAGTIKFLEGYVPYMPTLQSPANGAMVGTSPTLLFSDTDVKISRFIQYRLEIFDYLGNSACVTSQIAQDAGWGGQPYYQSGQMAYYNLTLTASSNSYTWHVAATNSNGNGIWSSWSALHSFTVTNDSTPPAKPILLSPPRTPVQINVSKTPALSVWCSDQDNGNTLTFSLVLSQDPSLSNPQIFQPTYPGWDSDSYFSLPTGVTATCQVLNTQANADVLMPGATYYWQATAYDSYMTTSISAKGQFSVLPCPPTPILLSPANAGTITINTPLLQMNCASPNTINLTYQYKLEIGAGNFQTVTSYLSQNGNGWDSSQYASGQTASLQIPAAYGLLPGQAYSWRVTAYDVNNDNWSPVSAPYAFTVVTPPNLPVLLSPDNNYVAPNSAVTFQFQATSAAGNTLTYRYELSNNNFQSVLQNFDQGSSNPSWSSPSSPSGVPVTFMLPAATSLARGLPYQWRVSAFDGFSWSPNSETRSFSLAANLELQISKIYPNPAVSRQNIHVMLQPTVDADATLHLFNSQAKEIRRVTWHLQGGRANDYLLDISNCAPGAYFTITEVSSPYGTQKWVSRFAVVN